MSSGTFCEAETIGAAQVGYRTDCRLKSGDSTLVDRLDINGCQRHYRFPVWTGLLVRDWRSVMKQKGHIAAPQTPPAPQGPSNSPSHGQTDATANREQVRESIARLPAPRESKRPAERSHKGI